MTETSTKFVVISKTFAGDSNPPRIWTYATCDNLPEAQKCQVNLKDLRPEYNYEIQVETTTKITESLAEWEAAQKSNAKAHPFH